MIMIGGVLIGFGIELLFWCVGFLYESVLLIDVFIGVGELVRVTLDGLDVELFVIFFNFYGMFGYAVVVMIEFMLVSWYVYLCHVCFEDVEELVVVIVKFIDGVDGERVLWDGELVDFIDVSVFLFCLDDGLVWFEVFLMFGMWVDEVLYMLDYMGMGIYYWFVCSWYEDWLIVWDYLWWWDIDWFWCLRVFGV